MKPTLRSMLMGAALLTGCAAQGQLRSPDGGIIVTNMCMRPTDCSASASCIGGRCVARDDRARIVLTAEPPRVVGTRENGSRTEMREVRSLESVPDIQLPRTQRVVGGVFGTLMGQRVEAQVRFTRSMATLGETGVSVLSMLGDETTGGIRTELAPGLYDAFVEPTDQTAYPPWRLQGNLLVRESANNQDETTFSVHYSRPLAVSGSVLDRDVGAGVGGLFVRAVDSAGNAASTRTVTTNGSGSFRLLLSPLEESTSWSLEITTGAPISQAARELPPSRFVYRIASTALAINPRAGYEGLSITIPGLARFAQTAEGICPGCVAVEASVQTERLENVVGSTVYLHGSVIPELPRGHVAWYESYARTDVNGDFNVWLVPGGYDAVITPQDSSNTLAITSTEMLVPEMPLRGRTLTVHDRVPIRGRLQDSAGGAVPLGGVVVRAIPLREQGSNGTTTVSIGREVSTETLADGTYTLMVDPGRYVLLASPSADTGFAAAVHLSPVDRVIPRATDATELFALSLAAPVIVRGRVLSSAGMVLQNARVSAAARVVLRTTVDMVTTEVALDLPLASDMTGPAGDYELLVPPVM